MHDANVGFINEEFYVAQKVSAAAIDALWADGWRHFDAHFFRYNLGVYEFDLRVVIPLRVRLSEFTPTKSQRRVLRRNADLHIIVRPFEITSEIENLFHRHKQRFKFGVPNSIYDFLPLDECLSPTEVKEIVVFEDDKLVAVSYFDIGRSAVSGIYAMFEPAQSRRSLGIFTMLKEIEFAIEHGKEFYYQGYCYEGESYYDYKKRFSGTERYDWKERWEKF